MDCIHPSSQIMDWVSTFIHYINHVEAVGLLQSQIDEKALKHRKEQLILVNRPNSVDRANSPHVIGPLRLFSSDAFFLRTYTYGVVRTRKLVH